MDPGGRSEDEVHAFLDEVEKEIIVEGPPEAFHHPRPGDLVTAGVGNDVIRRGDDLPPCPRETCTWHVGRGAHIDCAGVELDRLVRTMRLGEHATARRRGDRNLEPADIRLLALEHTEDLLGDGRLVRTTVQNGTGWQMPQAGTELRVRFSWRVSHCEAQGAVNSPEADEALPVPHMGVPETVILLAGPVEQQVAASASRAMADFRRALLRRFAGDLVVRFVDAQVEPAAEALVLVMREDQPLLGDRYVGLAEASAELEASAVPAAHREAREVVISVEEHRVRCCAEDWIPGSAGLRVLSDMHSGQRCLVRVAPELAHGAQGLAERGIPPDAALEYDVELLQIMVLEDVSLDQCGGVTKKTTRDGEGYDRPTEGAEVTMRLEARDDASGAVLLEEREVKFLAASGRFCPAMEETVLIMKRGETCEVRCADAEACRDKELGLDPGAGDVVILTLELVDFEKLDLYGLGEADRVAHCARRKEVGGKFFQEGNVRRALKRYQHVATTVAYLDHWKDEVSKAEAVEVRRLCHLNAGACHLKLEDWRAADASCSMVLRAEPENVKALFRQARALQGMGELRRAEANLRRVLELDTENKEAARLLLQLRQAVKSEVEKKKAMFSRMAKGIGGAAADAEPDEPSPEDDPMGRWRAEQEELLQEQLRQEELRQRLRELAASAGGAGSGPLERQPGTEVPTEEEDPWDEMMVPMASALLAVCAAAGFVWLRRRWQ